MRHAWPTPSAALRRVPLPQRALMRSSVAMRRVLSRAQLMDRVWADALDSGDRTVDTHIKTLRSKLRISDDEEDPIRTHRGLGYSLETGA